MKFDYTDSEIEKGLKELQDQWRSKKDNHKNPKAIESAFDRLKKNLSKWLKPNNPLADIEAIKTFTEYNILIQLLKENDLDYTQACLSAPTSDKIKIFIEYSDNFTNAYHFIESVRYGVENKESNWFLQ